MSKEYYDITLAGVKRALPLFEVAPGLKIAVLNILGDTELVEACADELAKKLENVDYDVMVTVESKSIPIIYALPVRTKEPIAKDMLLPCAEAARKIRVDGHVRLGEAIRKDFLGTGTDLVASMSL